MSEKLPLISVIVPVYKVETVLRRCVDSLLAQTYPHVEIILVNDGSPDGSPAICDEYAAQNDRVQVVHRENGGLSAARNSGIDASHGEHLAFVDSDDYVAEDYLAFMYDLLSQNGADIAACGAATVHFSGNITVETEDTSVHVIDSREALERMCYNDQFYVTTWDKLYRRSLFDDIRFPEGKLFEDTGTTYRLVDKAQTIVYSFVPKYFYVRAENSITSGKFSMKKLDYVEMADAMAAYITENYPDLTLAARRKQLHACLSTLTQLVNSRMREPAVEKALIARINALRPDAMKDPRTPRRDKLAMMALRFGFPFFSFAWRIYCRGK